MAEGIDQAAEAFTESMEKAVPAPRSERGREPEIDGPVIRLFDNVGRLEIDEDSPEKGGGDDLDPEELIYGKQKPKAKSPPRHPREGDEGTGEDEPDESDGDDDDGTDDGDDGEEGDEEEAASLDDEILRRKVEVTVDGEPAEVTVKEALEGYVR